MGLPRVGRALAAFAVAASMAFAISTAPASAGNKYGSWTWVNGIQCSFTGYHVRNPYGYAVGETKITGGLSVYCYYAGVDMDYCYDSGGYAGNGHSQYSDAVVTSAYFATPYWSDHYICDSGFAACSPFEDLSG